VRADDTTWAWKGAAQDVLIMMIFFFFLSMEWSIAILLG